MAGRECAGRLNRGVRAGRVACSVSLECPRVRRFFCSEVYRIEGRGFVKGGGRYSG